jgi:hypothetical protein
MQAEQLHRLVTTVLNSHGFSAVIGGVVGSWLTQLFASRWQRRVWVNDNKKAEWRELLDVVREGNQGMLDWYARIVASGGRAGATEERFAPISVSTIKADMVFHDRIFISKEVRDAKLYQRWNELFNYCTRNAEELKSTIDNLVVVIHDFQNDLIRVSREDLGIERPWYKLW